MQRMHTGGSDDPLTCTVMAACARALDCVSGADAMADGNVDISKELHALEADVLRACVLGGTGPGDIPWREIMHAPSQSSHAASNRGSVCGSSGGASSTGGHSTRHTSVDIDRELACMVKDTLVAVSSSAGWSTPHCTVCSLPYP